MVTNGVWSFSDPDQYTGAIVNSNMRLIVWERGPFRADLARVRFDTLGLLRGQVSLATVTHSAVPNGQRVFVFLAPTDQPPMRNSGFEVMQGDLVSYRLGSVHHLRTDAGYAACTMFLKEEDLHAHAISLMDREPASSKATRVLRPQPASMARLQDLHNAATNLAASNPDTLTIPAIAKALEQQLIHAMVTCLIDPDTEARHEAGTHRTRIMQRLEQLLEERPNEPLYLTEVCSAIGVSDRTLRLHSQEHLGMSPHKYLWLRRMNLAQRALLASDPSRTVTEIATDYGFWELGRFSVAYRKLFGEAPSATLRRSPSDQADLPTRTWALGSHT